MFSFEEFLKALPTLYRDGTRTFIAPHEIADILQTHPIVMMPKGLVKSLEPIDESIPLDMPFKSLFLEFFEKPISAFSDSSGSELKIAGIYIKEVVPREYHLLSLLDTPQGPRICFFSSKEIQAHLLSIVKEMLKRFYSEKIGFASVRRSIKIRSGEKHRIGRVVYVSPKSSIENTDRAIGRHVEWTHRWHVRGHWRSIPNKIGKDREENPIPNWTWITNYIKGPEDAEVILKPHIVK
jgi:hypothetical protein